MKSLRNPFRIIPYALCLEIRNKYFLVAFIINKWHIIQRIILMEFTALEGFPKQVTSIVESFSLCAGIPLDVSRQNGISRNCLPPFTVSTIPAWYS